MVMRRKKRKKWWWVQARVYYCCHPSHMVKSLLLLLLFHHVRRFAERPESIGSSRNHKIGWFSFHFLRNEKKKHKDTARRCRLAFLVTVLFTEKNYKSLFFSQRRKNHSTSILEGVCVSGWGSAGATEGEATVPP